VLASINYSVDLGMYFNHCIAHDQTMGYNNTLILHKHRENATRAEGPSSPPPFVIVNTKVVAHIASI